MPDDIAGISRRTVLRGTTAAMSAIVLGAASSATAWAAPGDELGDGAPAGDSRFATDFAEAQQRAALAAETSYNGWPVGTPASAIGVASYTIPGTSLSIQVKSGDVATVLTHLAARFHAEVENLRAGQVGGYSYRRNVNNPSVWSNHASGTAIDLNWNLHPNGSQGTFSSGQVAALRNVLSFFGSVIFWGGDYRGTIDEMHFEINVPPGNAALASVAARIRGAQGQQRVVFRAAVNGRYVVAESAGSAALIANRQAASTWEMFDVFNRGGNDIALLSRANGGFVCADNYGNSPLIANRAGADTWETFELIRNSDGTVSLRSRANGLIVCADNYGNSPLIANRGAIDVWEKFEMIGV